MPGLDALRPPAVPVAPCRARQGRGRPQGRRAQAAVLVDRHGFAAGDVLRLLGARATRRAILERLKRGPCSVGKLADGLAVSQPAVSQHLRVLEQARLVAGRREGTRHIYSVCASGLSELRGFVESFWDDVLSAYRNGEPAGTPPREEKNG